MCGIAGFIYKDSNRSAEQERLIKMTDAIAHRGPDAEGTYVEGCIALGHRRLSIIDLSEDGNQPMFSHDNRYIIVYNGEIYNYLELRKELEDLGAKFQNNTDTEVIIEAYRYWGNECVKRFNGMWAFALWDRQKEQIFFSRDRFGVKPLYILEREDVVAFASEVKAIISAFPEENVPDYTMVYRYLNGTPENRDEHSFYRNVKIFGSSTYAVYDLQQQKFQIGVYWDVDEDEFRKKWITGRNPVQTFKGLIEDAVELRMRADVEVGASLSGGLDSSAIVGICCKKYGLKMHTFSSIYSDNDCNEKKYVDAVNQFNNTIPHLIYPEPEKISLIEAFQKVIYHHDGPNGSASLYSQYSVIQGVYGHVKVLLDGQGADELFGGYISDYGFRLADILSENAFGAKLKAIKTMAILAEEWPDMFDYIQSDTVLNALGVKLYKKLYNKLGKRAKAVASSRGYSLFTKHFLETTDRSIHYSEKKISGNLNTRLCKELTRDSIPAILHNCDGNTMAFSIEARIPFMDYRVVEFGLALDGKYKIKNEWTKWIIRKACKDYLPSKVAQRKNKMGFPAPFARWLRECKEKDEMRDIIYALGERDIVPKETIDLYYRQHMSEEVDRNIILYKFLVLELWFRTCNIETK